MLTQFIPENYSTISFPALHFSWDPIREIDIGGILTIRMYGLIIALGLVLAVIYGVRRANQFGLKSDDIYDGLLIAVPLSIICARLYYCAFSWSMYKDDPISILYIWNGGLAIYGAVIGAVIAVVIFCRIKKLRLTAVLDIMALGFLIGQCVGRWGNFFNREAFGDATDIFLKMGLYNTHTHQVEYYHPTFLYESLWNLAGFLLLHFLSKKRQYDGQIALGYAAWYGLGRTFIEGLRVDSLYWGTFRVSQILGAATCFVAAAILLWQAFLPHDREKLFVNVVARRQTEPPAPEKPAEAEAPAETEAPAEAEAPAETEATETE